MHVIVPVYRRSTESDLRRQGVAVLLILLAAQASLVAVLLWHPHHHGLEVLVVLVTCLVAAVLHRRASAATTQLAAAQSRIEVIGAGSDNHVWESDAEGNLVSVGPGIQELFGYTPREATGLNLRDVVHPLEFERLARYVEAGEGWVRERWRCVRKDGSEAWFTGSGTPQRRADGSVVGYLGTTRPLGVDELEQHRLSELATEVYSLLASRSLEPVFQPILSVDSGRIVGVEALSRFPGAAQRNPEEWFLAAGEVGLRTELELLAVRLQLAAAAQVPQDVYVSVNVSPRTLGHPDLLPALVASSVPPTRLVLEVTEHETISDYAAVLTALEGVRELGARVAVDDAGAGYASFRHILRLRPEIIKLDRSLITGLHEDPALRALAGAVVAFARDVGARVCAEGIEVVEEFQVLRELGIDKAQGYFFGRPTGDWSTWNEWHSQAPLLSARHRRASH